MGRPNKTGLDNFPFDVDFFSNDKISAVAVQYGIKGEITAVKLLCAIYRNGYYLEWTDTARIALLRVLPGISKDLLDQLVKTLVKWKFFDPDMFFDHNVLTSKDIQRRYFTLFNRNKRNKVLTEELPFLLDNQKKEKPTYTITPATQLTQKAVSEQQILDDLRASEIWLEQMCMRHSLDRDIIFKLIDDFALDCKCRDKVHENTTDAKRHFNDWLRTNQVNKVTRRRPAKVTPLNVDNLWKQ